MRSLVQRFGALVILAAPLAAFSFPAVAGGDQYPPGYGHGPIAHPHGGPVHAMPTYIEPHHGAQEQNLRKRPHYWRRPLVHKIADKEIVPSCYMKRERIWLDRYTYTHKYHRHCD